MPNAMLEREKGGDYTILLNEKGKPTGFKTCNKCNRVLKADHECGLHDDEKVTKAKEKEHAAALESFVTPPPGIRPPGWRKAQGESGEAQVVAGTAMPFSDSPPMEPAGDVVAAVSGSDADEIGDTTDQSTPGSKSKK